MPFLLILFALFASFEFLGFLLSTGFFPFFCFAILSHAAVDYWMQNEEEPTWIWIASLAMNRRCISDRIQVVASEFNADAIIIRNRVRQLVHIAMARRELMWNSSFEYTRWWRLSGGMNLWGRSFSTPLTIESLMDATWSISTFHLEGKFRTTLMQMIASSLAVSLPFLKSTFLLINCLWFKRLRYARPSMEFQ